MLGSVSPLADVERVSIQPFGLGILLLGLQRPARPPGGFQPDRRGVFEGIIRLAVATERPQHHDLLLERCSNAGVVFSKLGNGAVRRLAKRTQGCFVVAVGLEQGGFGNLA